MEVFKQLRSFYWPGKLKYLIFASILCLAVSTALGLVYPYMLKHLVDEIIMKGNYGQVPFVASTVLVVVAIKAGFQFLHGLAGGRLGNQVAYNLRKSLYEKLQYLSFQYYDKARTGDLMSRLTGDLDGIRQFIGFGFPQFLNVFLMVGFGSIMMAALNWKLMLITLVTMPFLVFTAFRFESKIHPAFREIRKSMSDLTTAVQENITGVRTVKSFARESHEVEKFSVRNDQFRENLTGSAFIWARYFPVMEVFANLSIVILLATGGTFVLRGEMTTGELLAFFSLIWYIIGPMWGLGFHINNYTQSKASGERVLEILNQYIHVKNNPNAVPVDDARSEGHVQFENVTFAYPENAPALVDFSVDAKPGSVIGLLGPTGSGKSTVFQLLMRAYNVKDGRILLDGKDIKELELESLRQQIAIVFQETFLFSSTIRNNIAYGQRDISMERIVEAAKLAQAHDFIMELPLGYDTIVGERGMGLSGGQKQRIAIARAILENPKVLLLDDATSAVDMETEHVIQQGLRQVMNGRTTFVVAHRISSLKHADEIIVLDEGRIVQRGTHQELLAQPGRYRETYNIQYSDHPDLAATRMEQRGVAHG
ncbi:ABC transporter ATP-binding protein [Paenibacillus antri]|uniref:ABC transporter ATP-binding protein n=1 Tax=Paenibacillus antri TaxID=2582848 RepID=A0A5R9GJT1_9BACL|nr:ABC transporter ATP-binding protein [Paenibacillus antri]TLS53163.1 ABC transporter ATP-binding protein [Paenibacillus antri]